MPNPMFNDNVFSQSGGGTGVMDRPAPPYQPQPQAGWSGPDPVASTAGTMTIGGTCSATGAMLAVLGVGAWFGWGQVDVIPAAILGAEDTAKLTTPALLFGSLIVGFGLAILTFFKPHLARFTALPYALAEGVLLGMISHLYEVQTQGIALQAVIATCGVFAMMLLLYGLRILRATPRFVKGVIAATFGVMAIYLVDLVVRAFGSGSGLGFVNDTSGISILFSVVVVGIAAFNLILDFDFIERGTAERLPKAMEWYGAFGLVVTIVWLYLEMLRLLSKLRR